jgi:hypothetical protein
MDRSIRFRPATAADVGGHSHATKCTMPAQFRHAEYAKSPASSSARIDKIVERGEEPTRAALKREIVARPQPKQMNPKALFVWGRLKDFEREGILDQDPASLLSEMTAPMREEVRRLVPRVREFLEELEIEA